MPFGIRCQYEWQTVTRGFEDPCSGAKFSRTGEYLDIYAYLIGAQVQNLDRYPVEVRGDHLWINTSQIIHTESFTAQGGG